jgi:hypothetical protein
VCCGRAQKQLTMHMAPSNVTTMNITMVFSGMEGLLDSVPTVIHMTGFKNHKIKCQ